jgi:hypothetical protein
MMGLYVPVANPDETILPTWAETDVLNTQAGVVYDGVEGGKLGNVVTAFAEGEMKLRLGFPTHQFRYEKGRAQSSRLLRC